MDFRIGDRVCAPNFPDGWGVVTMLYNFPTSQVPFDTLGVRLPRGGNTIISKFLVEWITVEPWDAI